MTEDIIHTLLPKKTMSHRLDAPLQGTYHILKEGIANDGMQQQTIEVISEFEVRQKMSKGAIVKPTWPREMHDRFMHRMPLLNTLTN